MRMKKRGEAHTIGLLLPCECLERKTLPNVKKETRPSDLEGNKTNGGGAGPAPGGRRMAIFCLPTRNAQCAQLCHPM